MAKKKRFCKFPSCGKEIWHKGSPDYTIGIYCLEHRKSKYDNIKKKLRLPEHETRLGTTSISEHRRKDFEDEAEFIRKHKNDVLSGKTQGYYATDYLAKENKGGIPYIKTERDFLMGTDSNGCNLAFNENEDGFVIFDNDGNKSIPNNEYISGGSELAYEMDDKGDWKLERDEKSKSRSDAYKDWTY